MTMTEENTGLKYTREQRGNGKHSWDKSDLTRWKGSKTENINKQGDLADSEDRAKMEHRDKISKLRHGDMTEWGDTGDARQETKQGTCNTGKT